ncbi:lariat debranching enzyme, C-terminal domain-containing protein [Amylocystis lapponica]|nr:lariat debranching enzyme, C-terminal domain-containing protein [Amylocystis lapponica]
MKPPAIYGSCTMVAGSRRILFPRPRRLRTGQRDSNSRRFRNFKPQDFRQGHWERVPYNNGSMRSIYHVREFNVRRLSLLSPPSIVLSHDWPQSIEQHGNVSDLLRRKPFFREDIKKGVLGSPPMMGLLRTLQPAWWFSAHLHCRFEALVTHVTPIDSGPQPDEIRIDDDAEREAVVAAEVSTVDKEVPSTSGEPEAPTVQRNADEIVLEEEEEDVEAPPPPPPPSSETRFLALDKCMPRRQFLEVVDVQEPPGFRPSSAPILAYDPEWLAITRAFHPYISFDRSQPTYPNEAEARSAVRKELAWVKANVLSGREILRVDDYQKFAMTAPAPGSEGAAAKQQPPYYPNPQTAAFCSMLEIENKIDKSSSLGALSPR